MQTAIVIGKQEFDAIMEGIAKLKDRVEILENTTIDYVTVKQARKILNKSKNTIYALIDRGELVKCQDGKNIDICMKSIRAYKEKYKVAA